MAKTKKPAPSKVEWVYTADRPFKPKKQSKSEREAIERAKRAAAWLGLGGAT